jgi:thermitase
MPSKRRLGWQHKKLKIAPLWDDGTEGRGTRVAILDTGVAAVGGLARSSFEYLDPDGNDIGPADVSGHGTKIASLVASSRNGAFGIAPKTAISSYRVLDGGDRADKVERALCAIATRDDIDVVLCAFTMDRVLDGIVDVVRALAMDGVVVVAAAGNDRTVTSGFPEHTPHVISVAGLTIDLEAQPSAQIGEWIDIAAPGDQLVCVTTDNDIADDFGESSGASAIVAGIAALVLGTRSGSTRRRVGMAIDGLMRSTARPLDASETAVGAGLVQPSALLDVVEEGF